MADETSAERSERLTGELREQYKDEGQAVTDAAVDARDDQPPQEGLETWDEYWDHAAKVPGIFGDTDTSGTAPEVDSVVSKNEEIGGLDVAAVDTAQAEGDEDAEGVDSAEAKRQLDATAGPSAQEVDAGADDSGNGNPDDNPEGNSSEENPDGE